MVMVKSEAWELKLAENRKQRLKELKADALAYLYCNKCRTITLFRERITKSGAGTFSYYCQNELSDGKKCNATRLVGPASDGIRREAYGLKGAAFRKEEGE